MPRKPRLSKRKIQNIISPAFFDFFMDLSKEPFDLFIATKDEKKAMWQACCDDVLRSWLKQYPGTRPSAWWDHEAPQEPVAGWQHFIASQRRRLGGTGTPCHEVLGITPHFKKGIPSSFVDQFSADYYNGKARDIHGELITTKYKPGNFKGVAPAPDDPPIFESESAYLRRHGLLTPAENRMKFPETEIYTENLEEIE